MEEAYQSPLYSAPVIFYTPGCLFNPYAVVSCVARGMWLHTVYHSAISSIHSFSVLLYAGFPGISAPT